MVARRVDGHSGGKAKFAFRRHSGGESETARRKFSTLMTILEIKGDWNIIKGRLKEKWAQLTEDDLQYIEGRQEELYGRIQKRTGETREAIEKAIKEASKGCGC